MTGLPARSGIRTDKLGSAPQEHNPRPPTRRDEVKSKEKSVQSRHRRSVFCHYLITLRCIKTDSLKWVEKGAVDFGKTTIEMKPKD